MDANNLYPNANDVNEINDVMAYLHQYVMNDVWGDPLPQLEVIDENEPPEFQIIDDIPN